MVQAHVEEPTLDGHKNIVEGQLEGARAVAVDDLQHVGVRDGEMVGRDVYQGACVHAQRGAGGRAHGCAVGGYPRQWSAQG